MRGPLSLMALAAALALGACMMVGPHSVRPQVPWLRDWSGGEWRALADAAPHRAPAPYDEWWRAFGDRRFDHLVAERQRVMPACGPPACASSKRAPNSALPAAHCFRNCSR